MSKFVITISHELGCGGAEIGKKLSEELSVPFVDRQILKMVADKLNISEEDVEDRDERMTSFWESFLRLEAFSNPTIAAAEKKYYPTDKELFDLESEYIKKIVNEGSAILLGRGCNYILRDEKTRLSVFVSANLEDRIKRVCGLYDISQEEAKKVIAKNDRERNQYMKLFAGREWLDARTYDLCINTSVVGIDNAVEMIKKCLAGIFGA